MERARDLFSNLPPPAECLAILFGCSQVIVTGLGGIANPIEWSKGYGLPIVRASYDRHASSEEIEAANDSEKTQIALASALAARNVQHGILILALACYARDRRALGIVITANIFTSLADTLIVRWFGTESRVAGHAIGLAASLGIGASLLHWKRGDPWW